MAKKIADHVLNNPGVGILTTEQINRTVLVTGISKKASIKQVSEFFSYCGNVEKILQDSENDDSQYAYVVFEREGSFSMALLLRNAVVVDQPIEVVAANKVLKKRRSSSQRASLKQASATEEPMVSDRSASDVIYSLIDAGYVRGESLMSSMKEGASKLDKQLAITDNLSVASQRARQMNEQYGITDTLTGLGQLGIFAVKTGATQAKEKAVLARDKISEGSTQAKEKWNQLHVEDSLKATATSVGQQVNRANTAFRSKMTELGVDEHLNTASSTVSAAASSSWNWVKDSFSTVKDGISQLRGNGEASSSSSVGFGDYQSSDDEFDDMFSRPEMDDLIEDVDAPEVDDEVAQDDAQDDAQEDASEEPLQPPTSDLIQFDDDDDENDESKKESQAPLLEFD
mmetsp:Transcript_3763/g.5560  ORF Transcript_3763/g.5560 Transcript_3763/m.5560 type:complete len:400 (+) Transcript_3763:43-1242(+)